MRIGTRTRNKDPGRGPRVPDARGPSDFIDGATMHGPGLRIDEAVESMQVRGPAQHDGRADPDPRGGPRTAAGLTPRCLMSAKRVLVLGGGFAGLWSAVGAARKLDEIGHGPEAVEV